VTVELDELEHHLDLANKVDDASTPAATKAEDLKTVTRMRRKLDALDVSVMAGFESTQEHKAQGHASPIG
jgi:hypothetical protein